MGLNPLHESDDIGIKTVPMIGKRFILDPIKVNFNIENNLINGDVFAVITNSGNYAKVQVTDYGYNLGIKWVTYAADTGPRSHYFERSPELSMIFQHPIHSSFLLDCIHTYFTILLHPPQRYPASFMCRWTPPATIRIPLSPISSITSRIASR